MAGRAGMALARRDGIVAIIVYRRKVLLLRRIWVPFLMSAPGIWSFLTGGRRRGESYIDAAYREIYEETGIGREMLRLVGRGRSMMLFDPVRRDARWRNMLFIFRSSTGRVRLNFENREYRWAGIGDIVGRRRYTNVFVRDGSVVASVRRSLEEVG